MYSLKDQMILFKVESVSQVKFLSTRHQGVISLIFY